MSSNQNLRERKAHQSDKPLSEKIAEPVPAPQRDIAEDLPPITGLDIARLIVGLLLVNVLLSYFITGDSYTWGYRAWWLRPRTLYQFFSTPVVLTDVELAQYDGRNASLPIYLGLDGKIYDVTAGRLTYGPGGPYNHFAGKDAVRAFVTGCFDEDSNPDLRGVEWTYVPKDVPRFEEKSDADMTVKEQAYRMEMLEQARRQVAGTVQGWAELFEGRSGKDYFEVGKIQRDEDWAEKEPLKKLCGPAEMSRPRTNFRGNDAGAKYREKKTQ